jgi:hypothetical protein
MSTKKDRKPAHVGVDAMYRDAKENMSQKNATQESMHAPTDINVPTIAESTKTGGSLFRKNKPGE